MMKVTFLLTVFLWATLQILCSAAQAKEPVHFAIYGLSHDHAGGFIPRTRGREDIELVGIIEPRQDLVARYAQRFHLDTNLFCASLEELVARTNVQAVATFTSTFEHRHVVELCASKGIHVMMEKPLAVNMKHARAIEAAAKKGKVQIVVNYETTWYPGNQAAYALVHEEHAVGDLRKLVIHDGHRGPKEIGCSADFLAWLTDPMLNGGGALTDFGCYGADLMTWLMDGKMPTSVFAVTQKIKPRAIQKWRTKRPSY
jgi:predicted dehydrogenase